MKIAQLKILNSKEKHKVERKLEEQFGIKKINGILIRRGAERLFLFAGSFTVEQIRKLEEQMPIERAGVYFAKLINEEIKLSIEGVQLMKEQITKNIYELDDKQTGEWMSGQDLQVSTGKYGFIILKHKDDFLGCGKASAEKIGNFVPKSRRVKPRGA